MRRPLILAAVLFASAAGAQVVDFQTGFEDGAAGGFGLTRTEGANTLQTLQGIAWDGLYAQRAEYTGVVLFNDAYRQRSISRTAVPNLYMRMWLMVPAQTLAAIALGNRIPILRGEDGATVTLGIDLVRGTNGFYLAGNFGGGDTTGSENTTGIATGTWHYVEIGFSDQGATRNAGLWIDDPLLARGGGSVTARNLSLDTTRVGIVDAQVTTVLGSAVVFIDNFAQSTTRIGTRFATNLHAMEFEGGGLTVGDLPAGKFSKGVISGTVSIDVETNAAHRGAFGVEVLDTDTVTLDQGAIAAMDVLADGNDDYYQRAWWLPSVSGNSLSRSLMGIFGGPTFNIGAPGGGTASYLGARSPVATLGIDDNGLFVLTAFDARPVPRTVTQQVPVTLDGWHLLELFVVDAGTANGQVVAYVDGIAIGLIGTNDWSLKRPRELAIGELAGTAGYVGADSFDDVRFAHAMRASTLDAWIVAGQIVRGVCTEVVVRGLTSNNTVVGPAEQISVGLLGGGNKFSDAGCSNPATTVTVGTHLDARFWVLVDGATPSPVTLIASHPDYVGKTRSYPLVITPAGPPTALELTGLPATAEPGTQLPVAVTARDSGGAIATTYSGTVHFSSSGGAAGVLPADYTFAALTDQGTHTFADGVRFDSPGTYTVTVTDSADGSLTDQATITIVPPEAPNIVEDANPVAVVNRAYRYNADGNVHATGTGPITFSLCGTVPPGMSLQAESGWLQWTPSMADTVPVCITATNSEGSDTYTFDVQVRSTFVPIAAAFTAAPSEGPAPLTVSFDASDTLGTGVLEYRWRFGDGFVAHTTGPAVQHTFATPGSFVVQLVVIEEQGGPLSDASRVISVRDAQGRAPPLARIVSSAENGFETLQPAFSCNCVAGDAPIVGYAWDLGNGRFSSGPQATATYGPGRYFVRLTVVDANGNYAIDTFEIRVVDTFSHEPPECSASVSPSSGTDPLDAGHLGRVRPRSAAITEARWVFDGEDGPEDALDVNHTYLNARWHEAKLHVSDANGLKCIERVPVLVKSSSGATPISIVSHPPSSATCGVPYSYQPAAVGSGPFTWSLLEQPADATVDAATGLVRWTPGPWDVGADGGAQRLVVQAAAGGQTVAQPIAIQVSCEDPQLSAQCGCGSTGAGLSLGVFALAMMLARHRKRS